MSDRESPMPSLTEGVRRVGSSTQVGGMRRHRRVALRADVSINHEGTAHPGRTEDISEGGVLLATDAPLALGDNVEVELNLPGCEPMTVKAEVRRLRPGNRHALLDPGVGLMFLELGEEEEQMLQAFVMRRIKAILFRDSG